MCPADVESMVLHRDKDKAKDKGEGMHKDKDMDKDMDKEKKYTSLRALYLYIVLGHGHCTFEHTALHFVFLNTFFTELVPPGWIFLQQSLSR